MTLKPFGRRRSHVSREEGGVGFRNLTLARRHRMNASPSAIGYRSEGKAQETIPFLHFQTIFLHSIMTLFEGQDWGTSSEKPIPTWDARM